MPSSLHPYAGRLTNLRKQAKDLLRSLRQGDADATARFAAHHPKGPSAEARLADAQLVVAREQGFPSWPKLRAALDPKTLGDELERLRAQLVADGKQEYLPLLTEGNVKRAIHKGIVSYEAHVEHGPEAQAYIDQVIKPCFADIIARGTWPPDAVLDAYYTQRDDQGVTYEGIGVSLEIRTPGQAYPGFSHAILDLWYGRF